jgi:hypothetical protein
MDSRSRVPAKVFGARCGTECVGRHKGAIGSNDIALGDALQVRRKGRVGSPLHAGSFSLQSTARTEWRALPFSTGKYRLLPAANFEFVAIGVFEEEGVVTRTVVLANFRPFKIFSASIAYEFGNAIHFFARVRPKRDPCVIRFMFFIPSKAKELRGFAAACRIESMVSSGLFVNESKLRQKFAVKIFGRFDVCHTQIDVIEATRFHVSIFNRMAGHFKRV